MSAALGLLALVLVLLAGHAGLTSRSPLVAGAVAPQVLAAGLCVRAAVVARRQGASPRPWWCLAAAFACLLLSASLLNAAGSASAPAVGGALLVAGVGAKLAFPLGVLVAMLSLSLTPLARRDRVKLLLDAVTVVGAGVMTIWSFGIGPYLSEEHGSLELGALVTVLYPLADLVLVIGVCTVALRGVAAAGRRAVQLLLAGALVQLAADTWLSWRSLQVSEWVQVYTPAVLIALSVPAFLLGAAAAVHTRALHLPQGSAAGRGRFRPVPELPLVALLLGFVLLLADALSDGLRSAGLVAAATVMTSGVALRQMVALRENRTLVRTDPLTGLPNRALLRERLDRACAAAARADGRMAVLLVDLDGFKATNDTYGHEAGDAVLVEFAEVLRRCVRASDTAARLGGDEFAVVVGDVAAVEDAVLVAERVIAAAARRRPVDGQAAGIVPSIGIAVSSPGEEPRPNTLLHRADMAMYAAKRAGRDGGPGWAVWDEALEVPDERAVLAEELADAIRGGGLDVHYQPIVTLSDGDLTAVEALVRWRHPTRGPLPPSEFVPLAEETGVVDELGRYVLETACRQVREWHRRYPEMPPLHLSVNASPLHVDRGTLAADVLDILRSTGFAAEHLVLEITEGTVVDEAVAIPQLELLRSHGVRIALDDFGTGYSSLRYLARLPVDILKLDRFFVAELNGDPEGAAVAEAVIRLGQALHLDTVAEGIEDPAQAEELAMLGFGKGQGFHYARPLTPEALAELIETAAFARR